MTPELKRPSVAMPFAGLGEQAYAQQPIDGSEDVHVPARKVCARCFSEPRISVSRSRAASSRPACASARNPKAPARRAGPAPRV